MNTIWYVEPPIFEDSPQSSVATAQYPPRSTFQIPVGISLKIKDPSWHPDYIKFSTWLSRD